MEILAEVHAGVAKWGEIALRLEVGLRADELGDYAPAFEHEQVAATAASLQ